MFFGTDFDRVPLFIVRFACAAGVTELRWRHAHTMPHLRSRRYEWNRQIARASVYDGDKQTAPACASSILGHRILRRGASIYPTSRKYRPSSDIRPLPVNVTRNHQ